MSSINVTISQGTYPGQIIGTSFQLAGKTVTGEWVYPNGFSYNEGSVGETVYTLLVFNSDKSVSVATSSTPLSKPSVNKDDGASWSGTLPSEAIDSARQQISMKEEELYRVRGSNYDSFHSNYQDTMLAGILVAMLGTTVLFYTFRQL